jgi:hypothetical protein
MKLRIQDNSIRLRLSQSDVHQLVHEGLVSGACRFPINTLKYTILHNELTSALQADFLEKEIKVWMPSSLVNGWDQDDRVGFDAYDTNGLYILIEKDFQCLQPRPNEDESDLYTNPDSSHKNCGNE